MTGTSDASDYRRAARGGGASRCSRSTGVPLIYNSLAGVVTLLYGSWTITRDPSQAMAAARGTIFRCSGALYRRTIEQWEGGKAWSSSAAATSVARVPP